MGPYLRPPASAVQQVFHSYQVDELVQMDRAVEMLQAATTTTFLIAVNPIIEFAIENVPSNTPLDDEHLLDMAASISETCIGEILPNLEESVVMRVYHPDVDATPPRTVGELLTSGSVLVAELPNLTALTRQPDMTATQLANLSMQDATYRRVGKRPRKELLVEGDFPNSATSQRVMLTVTCAPVMIGRVALNITATARRTPVNAVLAAAIHSSFAMKCPTSR